MKIELKFILISGLLILLTLPAGLTLADNGPHGGYTATTDACAGCHRAHTAGAARLLFDDVPNLCFTCHGTAGTGADTNVEDGLFLERDGITEPAPEGNINHGLKAGGFAFTLMDLDFDGAAASTATTSTHLNDGTTGTVWGNGALNSGVGSTISLSCTSCHDPHGGASSTGGATYRILRAEPLNSGAPIPVNIPDEGAKIYTVSDANNQYFGEGYPITVGSTWSPMESPDSDVSGWCAQCHTRYLATTSSGSTDSTDTLFAYRHMSQGSPGANCTDYCHDWSLPGGPPFLQTTAGPEWHHDVQCMTCHVAHGTSADAIGYAAGTFDPPGPLGPIYAGDSALLRASNRGVCQRCHGK